MKIEFSEAGHTYLLDGIGVPSVTTVMDGLLTDYSKVPKAYLERASARGNAVHRAAELWLENDLDESTLHPDVAPYFYQFTLWMKESGFELESAEMRVASKKYLYAGTFDLVGRLKRINALIDIKTTSVFMPSTGPQTAAYLQAYKETTGSKKTYKRFGLWLRPDRYELKPLTTSSDFVTFLSCLSVRRWNEANK